MHVVSILSGRVSSLKGYLTVVHRRPWLPGVMDCSLFAAGWCIWEWGIDPVPDLWGAYRGDRQADAVLVRHGGIEALVEQRLTSIGFDSVDEPEDGDIGIVTASDQHRTIRMPAIRFGPLWAIRTRQGVFASRYDHHRAWRAHQTTATAPSTKEGEA